LHLYPFLFQYADPGPLLYAYNKNGAGLNLMIKGLVKSSITYIRNDLFIINTIGFFRGFRKQFNKATAPFYVNNISA